jgi:hypothetical protein
VFSTADTTVSSKTRLLNPFILTNLLISFEFCFNSSINEAIFDKNVVKKEANVKLYVITPLTFLQDSSETGMSFSTQLEPLILS